LELYLKYIFHIFFSKLENHISKLNLNLEPKEEIQIREIEQGIDQEVQDQDDYEQETIYDIPDQLEKIDDWLIDYYTKKYDNIEKSFFKIRSEIDSLQDEATKAFNEEYSKIKKILNEKMKIVNEFNDQKVLLEDQIDFFYETMNNTIEQIFTSNNKHYIIYV
jgi:hypothetical protein